MLVGLLKRNNIMELKVYDQGHRGTCWNHAYILACNKLGIDVDVAKVTQFNWLTHPRIEKVFIENGYIKWTIQLRSPNLVDLWLKKGHYIVIGTSQGDFVKAGTPPYIMGQGGKSSHFFCIIADLWDKWKCQNSWWENWGEKGCFYIMKNEFRMFGTPRRLVI